MDSDRERGGRRMTRLRIPVQLRWSDMDAYGHINNVEMFRVLEEARIAAFWSQPSPTADGDWPTAVIDAGLGTDTTTLVASQEIEYLRPLEYRRAPVIVELWIGHLGGASIDVCYEVYDGAETPDAEPYARACTTLVLADRSTASPRRMTASERASWSPFMGPMVQLRRRRPAERPRSVGQ